MALLPAGAFSRQRQGSGPLTIGLVNNMPDAALRTTERHFRELLGAAAEDVPVCLRLFALPELPRGEIGRAHIAQNYERLDTLWTGEIDGLIVTGTEPRSPHLMDEPYWPALARLVDWAQGSTLSTIWSCLAAHAAVLQLDGIERTAFPEKLSGVFPCAKSSGHPIMAETPAIWSVPHSRYNDLPEAALAGAGYEILSRSPRAGVDIFAREGRSLFVFFQGHPEYDAGALLREYRRDVGRFLAGERESFPELPFGCFDEADRAAFDAFRKQALRDRRSDGMPAFPAITSDPTTSPWRTTAVRIYANWLSLLAARRSAQVDRAPERIAI
ncbi:MAG: homoserine O-succinyltransferase [Alphaproteobacteria bacterium]|nr:homoserine O-succinyltransferase [Alphaproteobacteria bacterium]